MKRVVLCALLCFSAFAQMDVMIRVDASQQLGPFRPIYRYFGYDEPNYTYMKDGRKLVGELSSLTYAPVYIRTHNLLTTGNGEASLKWGSTNAYTAGANGRPVYDWTIVDRIIDTYLQAKAKPFVEIGFMPEALSTHPQPYRHSFPNGDVFTGWSYPPNDYAKWSELVYRWVSHTVEKYGRAEVESWYWEVWNEPDIAYWHGTVEEYEKLYDATASAVKRALPTARVGGPGSTGPASPKAAAFLRHFLEHCARSGAPLDFITYHAKGRPTLVDGHVRMGIAKNLQDVEQGLEVIHDFQQFGKLPIVLSESDPEGCAACSVQTHPQNAYRNGTLYPSYTAVAFKAIAELAERHQANLEGMLTWAFEFENQPYFAGFRDLATNGIDKPILNLFRMLGMIEGERVKVESSGAVGLPELVSKGVQQSADVDALAIRGDRRISVMAWNYHDDDIEGPAAGIRLAVNGIPQDAKRVLLRHYRVDPNHSNSYTAWKAMGSPAQPTPDQYRKLEAAGQLELLEAPRWLWIEGGQAELQFTLPRQGVSLVELSW